jgi:hypothetical protein
MEDITMMSPEEKRLKALMIVRQRYNESIESQNTIAQIIYESKTDKDCMMAVEALLKDPTLPLYVVEMLSRKE